MEVSAIFAADTGDGLVALDAWFQGIRPTVSGVTEPFEDAAGRIPRSDSRSPVVVVDTDSLARGTFTTGVVKDMKVRGCDIWFMTCIETVDDLFDSFNTTADMVMGAYHHVESDAELEDIHSVSDSFVPTVFIVEGMAVRRNGTMGSISAVMSELTGMGFYRLCLLDTDGSLTTGSWDVILEDHPSAIPFTRRPPGPEAPSSMWVSPLRQRTDG